MWRVETYILVYNSTVSNPDLKAVCTNASPDLLAEQYGFL